MRYQVNIYRYTTTPDGAGGNIETRTLYRSNAWIDISVRSVNTLLESGQYVSSKVIDCKLRYRDDLPLKDNDIIEWKNNDYVVNNCTEIDRDYNRFQTFNIVGNA